MKINTARFVAMALACVFTSILFVHVAVAQNSVDENRVRAHMEFLASDEMQGRGSGTSFEKLAVLYAASQMQQFGIAPGGDIDGKGLGAYIQTVTIEQVSLGNTTLLAGGKSIGLIPLRVGGSEFAGEYDKPAKAGEAKKGSIAVIRTADGTLPRTAFSEIFSSAATAVIVVASPQLVEQLSGFARRGSAFTKTSFQDETTSVYLITEEDAKMLDGIAGGTQLSISSAITNAQTNYTWNAVGKIEGTGSNGEAVLLSAHIDHLGVRENAPGDDKIFNGADDDASGCVAVLELARIFAAGRKPRRTIYFAFFGSEEQGGFGSKYFVNNLDFPLDKLVANLQFEMIGRPDEKVGKDELWLTGYERSDLGAELAKNGAKIVADPHPEQSFFTRSDNITLARKGVVAHTVSSFGLHKDYHQASDEIETMDFPYMTNAINSMVPSVSWLANTDWKPSWKEGMKP